jgi:hypothetical protein
LYEHALYFPAGRLRSAVSYSLLIFAIFIQKNPKYNGILLKLLQIWVYTRCGFENGQGGGTAGQGIGTIFSGEAIYII